MQRARREIRAALSRDQRRLRKLLDRWEKSAADDSARAAFEQALATSKAAREQRAELAPKPTLSADLPVLHEADAILRAIHAHQVIVIAGETGSGKTTQLPQLCLAAGRGQAGLIGCTQPRRIAARSVARRVAEELGSEVGQAVGFQVRFNEQVGENTYVKFMTDGILLAEIASDRMLSRYDTLIIDEAHERSLNIDFLLGFLQSLLRRRPDLKLIVTSATIDTGRFSRHFDNAPVIDVEGRSHPVEVRYRPLNAGTEEAAAEQPRQPSPAMAKRAGARRPPRDAERSDGERSINDGLINALEEIGREDPLGDVLVFLPGEREIRDAHLVLSRRNFRETEIVPLYARLSSRDQDKVFRPGPKRRVVLATNVAETSLTVPRIRYVIDPGVARVKRYSPRQKLDRLQIEAVSQASANQRKGRCGRVAAGICYRLYDEADFEARSAFTDPEILRSSLAGVILRMLALGLGAIETFPFIDPPAPRAINDGWQQLQELGAVDPERRLTPVGRQMARLPIDPKLARMLIESERRGALREMLTIASFLGIQDPRERPAEARQAADAAHAEFSDPRSEFVGLLNLWRAYQSAHEDLTQSQLRDWCSKRFVSFMRMREWRELHRQLRLVAEELGWQTSTMEADYPTLHKSVLAGLPTQIGRINEKRLYEAPRQRKYVLFPGSNLSKSPPKWVLSAALLETRQVYGLINARIEPEWVVEVADHLLARRHYDPRWSRSQGRVLASEEISLFGLVLAPKRPISFSRLDPTQARDIFVREGLVPGEINTRAGFVERNLQTLEAAREEEAKQRRSGLVMDDTWQADWYLQRLPADVDSAAGLDAWYRRADQATRESLEWALTDLLPGEGPEGSRFPSSWRLGDARLDLRYRFEPGAVDDGVTLVVPLHLLNAIEQPPLDWLVPGLLEDKVAALLRGLPKTLRRNFVPVPDYARAFVEAHVAGESGGGDGLLIAALGSFLKRLTGVEVPGDAWDLQAADDHLRFNLRLLGDDGHVLLESRDLNELKEGFGDAARNAFAVRAGREIELQSLETFPDADVPLQIPGAAGVPAFPALTTANGSVQLKVFADRAEAAALHPSGVRALVDRKLSDRVRQARRQLPVSPKLGLLYAAIENSERLREDLVDAALNAVCGDGLGTIRTRGAFEAESSRIGRMLFPEAVARLELAERILAAYAELAPRLQPELMGFAAANFDDLRRQLRGLVHPGFLRETPFDRLGRLPRYLQGMRLRLERMQQDPARDQQRMLEIIPFLDALDAARSLGVEQQPAWRDLRWLLEELRISLFAQELGTHEAVSPKRLARALATARSAAAA